MMKFEELKKSLQTKIQNNYLLYGNDDFVITYAQNMIVEYCHIAFPEMNDLSFSEDFDMQSVLKALETVPMMSDYKVVRLNLMDDKKKCLELVDYLKNANPTTVLIVNIHDQYDAFKSLASCMNAVDCNRLSEKLVSAYVVRELNKQNKKITAQAMQRLGQYCLLDLATCMNECIKVAQIIGDREIIEVEDIESNVTKNIEYQIFELTESLAKKQSNRVYELLGSIKQKKENIRTLPTLIFNHFRRMLHVSLSKSNKSELASLLGVKEYAITKTLEQSKLFSKRALKAIFDECVTLDESLKNSEISPEMAVDYLCLYVLNL